LVISKSYCADQSNILDQWRSRVYLALITLAHPECHDELKASAKAMQLI
jgi:hypothetical protein